MSLLEEAFYGAGFDESKHPRHPEGTPEGGQFRTLYHVTPVQNRAAIRREGLRVDAEKRYADFKEPGVFVWDNFEDAWMFATTGERMYGDFDIWQTNGEGLKLEPDPFFQAREDAKARAGVKLFGETGAWLTRESIPAEKLELRFGSPWFPEGRFKDLGEVIISNPDAGLEVHMSSGGIKLDQIRVHPEKRGQGIASNALDDVLEFADQRGLPVVLDLGHDELDQKMFGGLSKTAKEKWYRSRGFVPNRGRNKDFAFTQGWIRKPQAMAASSWDESEHPRHPKGTPMGGRWKSLKPGDRVAVAQTGQEGTVEKVSVPAQGLSQGLAYVRVKWDQGGESSRVANPGMNLAEAKAEIVVPRHAAAEKLIDDLIYGKGREFTGNPEGVKALYMDDPRDAIASEFDLNTAPPMSRIEKARAIVEAKSQLYLRKRYPDGQVTLYRGGEGFREVSQPLLAWTPKERTALMFAGNDPARVRKVTVPIERVVVALPGLSITGYDEEEYLLKPVVGDDGTVIGSGWDESEHPRWPEGHSDGGKFRPKDEIGGDPFDLPEVLQAKGDSSRRRIKVGEAKNLRVELEEWYYVGTTSTAIHRNGVMEPWATILDNWGNWNKDEMHALAEELRKQLREKGEYVNGKWVTSGLLSGEYAKEVGRSLSQARNEARRLLDALDKQLVIEDFGEEYAREHYPEFFESKAPKIKQPNPRDQGIPEVYLSEKGTFKPGYDAKLKSDLVASALGLNPQKQVVSTTSSAVTPQTQSEVIRWWKERNADEQARNNWPDMEIWKIAKNDPMMPRDLANAVIVEENRKTRWTVESTLLHRFEPAEAIRIMDERGWTNHLWKKTDSMGLLLKDPTPEDTRSREILETTYGARLKEPFTTRISPGVAKGGLDIRGFNIARVQETVGEAAEIPDTIHRRLRDAGVELYFGPPESTDLDEMWHIRDEKARNRDRRTMKQVAGFYSPSTKRVIISADSRYGSSSLAAHEIGHAMGDVLGVDDSPALIDWHSRLKGKSMLGPYYLQHGDDRAGRQELWAEGVGLHYYHQRRDRLGRVESYKRSGPFKTSSMLETPEAKEYMDWVARTLKELERGGQIPS